MAMAKLRLFSSPLLHEACRIGVAWLGQAVLRKLADTCRSSWQNPSQISGPMLHRAWATRTAGLVTEYAGKQRDESTRHLKSEMGARR